MQCCASSFNFCIPTLCIANGTMRIGLISARPCVQHCMWLQRVQHCLCSIASGFNMCSIASGFNVRSIACAALQVASTCAALQVALTCAALLVQHCKWLQHVAFPPTHPPTLHIASDLLGLTSALRCAYLCVFGKAVPQTTPKIGTYLDASWSHLSTDL